MTAPASRIDQTMRDAPQYFQPENARGVDAVVQLHFTGREAGDWFLIVNGGNCSVESGIHPSATMKLTIDGQDYLDILDGRLQAMSAFMQGRIQFEGDLNLAMRFPTFFQRQTS